MRSETIKFSLLISILATSASVIAQQTAVQTATTGDKVYIQIDGLSLRSNLDTLFQEVTSLQGQIDALSWADVLENGTTPGVDVNFFGYDATGLGQVTTTGTFTGDSLVLMKDAAIAGRLDLTGVAALGDSLLVEGTVVLNDSLRVVQAVNLGSRLHVTGVTALGDSLHVVGNVDLDALFNLDGAATFGSTLNVTGETTFSDTLHVQAGALFSDSVYVAGGSHFASAMQVDGASTFGSTLSVAGMTALSDALGVAGKATLADSLIANGGVDFNTTLNVDGATTLNGTTVDGNLDLNGNGDVSGTWNVSGATTLGAALSASGETTLNDTLRALAPAMLSDSLRVGGNTRLTQDLWVDGNTNISGTINIEGATTLGGSLNVTGVTSLGDSLHVTGGADFDGDVNVDGRTSTSTLNVTNTATFSGPGVFNDEATFHDSLYVNAPATFLDTTVFTGGAHVTGGLTLDVLTLDGVEIPALDNTDALPEGDSNLYYTAERQAALQSQLDVADSLNQVLTSKFFNLLNQIADSATVTTSAASNIGADLARLNATFSDGGLNPEQWGFILSSDANFSDSTIYTATLSSPAMYTDISGLTSATTYYYKSFIETILNRAEGSVISFNTVGDVLLASESSTVSGQTTATLSASIADNGGGTISATGFKWSQNADLSSGSTVSGNTNSGTYSGALSGLARETTYYFAPYATNEAGTFFGDTLSFTTWDACDNATALTFDSYNYNLVAIDGYCWFAENLRASSMGDGMPYGPGMRTSPNTNSANINDYGYLYAMNMADWAMMCPSGWRIPTSADWSYLANSFSGPALKTDPNTPIWDGNNSSGFNALPAGLAYRTDGWDIPEGHPIGFNSTALFATNVGSVGYKIDSGVGSMYANTPGYFQTFASVRCVKN